MSKRIIVAVIGLLAFAAPAAAQTRGSDWSILGAETLAPGNDAFYGAVGWPDTSFGWQHGVKPNFDAGLKLSLVYGVENTTTDTQFGMAVAAPLRWTLARRGNAIFALHIDPGIRFYTYSPVLFGFQIPFGINIEFPVRSDLKVGVGADFNASLFVTGPDTPSFIFGPLIGPYVEYHIDREIAIGLDTRFGPMIEALSDGAGTPTEFGFRTQMVLAYRP